MLPPSWSEWAANLPVARRGLKKSERDFAIARDVLADMQARGVSMYAALKTRFPDGHKCSEANRQRIKRRIADLRSAAA